MIDVQHCTCGHWIHPPQPCCPKCLALDPPTEPVEARGRIFSWTRTHQAFLPGIEVPFVTAVVELPHAGGRRVLGRLEGEPEIGAEVSGEARTEDGVAVLYWKR